MSKDSKKINHNQQFYAKRLNTESFSSPSLKDSLNDLATKMEQQIQVVKRKLRVKNLKMFRAREKIKTIEHQEALMRETLRQEIDRKIKNSQSNLEKLMLQKSSLSKSKSKFRETTLSRIKLKEDSLNEESFRKSQMYSRQSEKYLDIKNLQRTTSKATSYTQSPKKSYYPSEVTSDGRTFSLLEPRKKVHPNVLKVPEDRIKEKQLRKANLEQSKESRNLYEYIQKLNHIENKRHSRQDRLKETLKKSIDQQQSQNRRASQLLTKKIKNRRDSADATKSVIQNRLSFSELYAKKLQEKLTRKSLYQEISFRQGDRIMQEESAAKQAKRNNILLKETLKEVQMRANFRYRQMRKH